MFRNLVIYRRSCFFFAHTFRLPTMFRYPTKNAASGYTFYVIQLYAIRFFFSPTLIFCRSIARHQESSLNMQAFTTVVFLLLIRRNRHRMFNGFIAIIFFAGYNSYVEDEDIHAT